MADYFATPNNKKNGTQLFKLTDSSDHDQWKSLLQDVMFHRFHNVNMDALTAAHTLLQSYFEKHQLFKKVWKETALAHKDAIKDEEKDPFDFNPELAADCFNHAIETGEGFKDWLYPMYSFVWYSLSDKIQRQTSVVRRGDLVALLQDIKLAVHKHEIFNPDELDIAFARCTMAGEGEHDLMTFLSKLASYIQRLIAVKLRLLSESVSPASIRRSSRISSPLLSAIPTRTMMRCTRR
jgi:hypothetical protein